MIRVSEVILGGQGRLRHMSMQKQKTVYNKSIKSIYITAAAAAAATTTTTYTTTQ